MEAAMGTGHDVPLWGDEPAVGWQADLWERRKEFWAPDGPDICFVPGGPRAGKDRFSVWLNLDGLLDLHFERKAAGSALLPPVYSWVLAPAAEDYDQVWREYKAHTEPFPRYIRESPGKERIILFPEKGREEKSGIWLDFKSGWKHERMVGSGLDSLHITEGAKLSSATYDQATGRLASPGRAGKQIINGTPTEAPAAWYRKLYRRGQAGDKEIIFRAVPSWENLTQGNAQLRKLAAIKARVSDRRWRSNWGAELIADGSGLFRGLAAVETGRLEPPADGARYLNIYDPAKVGTHKGGDYHVCSSFRFDGAFRHHPRQVGIRRWLDESAERTERELVEVVNTYPGEFHFDDNGQLALEAYLRKILPAGTYLKPHHWSNALKADMVDELMRVIENGEITLLHPESCDDASQQHGELEDFTMTRSPSGTVRFNAPTTKSDDDDDEPHDDTVTPLFLCTWLPLEMGGDPYAAMDDALGASLC
jgi:hypothetical protein